MNFSILMSVFFVVHCVSALHQRAFYVALTVPQASLPVLHSFLTVLQVSLSVFNFSSTANRSF